MKMKGGIFVGSNRAYTHTYSAVHIRFYANIQSFHPHFCLICFYFEAVGRRGGSGGSGGFSDYLFSSSSQSVTTELFPLQHKVKVIM